MDQDEAKKVSARAAIEELPPQGVIGLGSGSTAKLFVDEVGARVKAGATYRGVPTSQGTRAQAQALGIPLLGDEDPWDLIAVTVDGADEVSESLDLIKGGGGALTREKIVNASSRRNVIIVDESKMKKRLGETWSVPVEVLRFGFFGTCERLGRIGAIKQRVKDGAVFITDAGNYIVDVKTGPMDDAALIDREMRSIPGVVETGLFIQRADLVIVAGPNGIRKLSPSARR
jgi:ribose 5-phosphate isomerase A